MRRRAFITLLAGAAGPWPLAARAQQTKLPVIGFINSGSPGVLGHLVSAFRQGPSDILARLMGQWPGTSSAAPIDFRKWHGTGTPATTNEELAFCGPPSS
jgi:hypothetical protein